MAEILRSTKGRPLRHHRNLRLSNWHLMGYFNRIMVSSFYFSTNSDSGQSILVEWFYAFSAQLNKRLRNRD